MLFLALLGLLSQNHRTTNRKYLPVEPILCEGADGSWWVVGEGGGKENVRKQKTGAALHTLHPSTGISEQEGLVATFHGRSRPETHTSWFESLPFSSEKEER